MLLEFVEDVLRVLVDLVASHRFEHLLKLNAQLLDVVHHDERLRTHDNTSSHKQVLAPTADTFVRGTNHLFLARECVEVLLNAIGVRQ